ncbi:MAG: FadR/GntR family transcriptional regulator [bacterium]|nr:FadR/GntR family transcriptional regulator [bacterium]
MDAKTTPAFDGQEPVVRTSLSDEIVSRIVDLVSRGTLQPGDRLPAERELCKRFGVGRTSLREALRSLSVMGILDGRVGEGTFVCSNSRYLEKTLRLGLLLDPKRVQDLLETRLMLESQTAHLAAQRATDEDLRTIENTVRGMKKALNLPDKFLEYDLQFHLAVAQATQNSILCTLLGLTRGYLQEWIKKSLKTPAKNTAQTRARLSLEQHKKILQHLKQKNAEGAREAMVAHIRSSSQDLGEQSDLLAST